MFEFDVNLSAIKALGDVAKRLQNFDAPLRESGAYLERRTKNRFDEEKDPDGRPWAPLKPSTLAAKGTTAILREKSILVGGIRFLSPTKNEVRVVSGQEYGAFHQTGTRPYKIRPKNKKLLKFQTADGFGFAKEVNHPGLPARPFLGINGEDVEKIRGFFEDYIAGR